jgi:hypothetical protein
MNGQPIRTLKQIEAEADEVTDQVGRSTNE